MIPRPQHLDLQKDKALTIQWRDGRVSIYPVTYLRKMSPSADARALREAMQRNPLTVLPANFQSGAAITAQRLELVGNYAVRIVFSDGHDTGIYSWEYLREIDPSKHLTGAAAVSAAPAPQPAHGDARPVPECLKERKPPEGAAARPAGGQGSAE